MINSVLKPIDLIKKKMRIRMSNEIKKSNRSDTNNNHSVYILHSFLAFTLITFEFYVRDKLPVKVKCFGQYGIDAFSCSRICSLKTECNIFSIILRDED